LASPAQAGLFDNRNRERAGRLMRVVDGINARMGSGTLRYAAAGLEQSWQTRFERRSPCYTTRWQDVLAVRDF